MNNLERSARYRLSMLRRKGGLNAEHIVTAVLSQLPESVLLSAVRQYKAMNQAGRDVGRTVRSMTPRPRYVKGRYGFVEIVDRPDGRLYEIEMYKSAPSTILGAAHNYARRNCLDMSYEIKSAHSIHIWLSRRAQAQLPADRAVSQVNV